LIGAFVAPVLVKALNNLFHGRRGKQQGIFALQALAALAVEAGAVDDPFVLVHTK
jgi:hypothetical protein